MEMSLCKYLNSAKISTAFFEKQTAFTLLYVQVTHSFNQGCDFVTFRFRNLEDGNSRRTSDGQEASRPFCPFGRNCETIWAPGTYSIVLDAKVRIISLDGLLSTGLSHVTQVR